jgi:hypothetical protein
MAKPERAPDLAAQPDKATLVIIRETYLGGAIVFWHYLDETMIGETTGKTYFVTPVTPGPHYVVITTENTGVAHFDFKPGKTYFHGEGIAMGMWRARTSGFYPMTPEAAEKAMKECTYLVYDPKSGEEKIEPTLFRQALDDYHKDVKENPDGFKAMLNYDGVVTKLG